MVSEGLLQFSLPHVVLFIKKHVQIFKKSVVVFVNCCVVLLNV